MSARSDEEITLLIAIKNTAGAYVWNPHSQEAPQFLEKLQRLCAAHYERFEKGKQDNWKRDV